MCKDLDLPIGFQFVEGNDILQVRIDGIDIPDGYCRGCYFLICENGVKKCSGCALQCTSDLRKDETDVIFVKVGEVKYDRTNE